MKYINEIRLNPDRKTLRADSGDICYLDLQVICGSVETKFPVFINLYVSGDAGIHVMTQHSTGQERLQKILGISIAEPDETVMIVLQAGSVPQVVSVSAISAGFRPETSRIRLLRSRKF